MSFNVKALGAFRKLGAAVLITAAILTLVMLFAGCKHKTESKKSEPKYTITFGVDGSNGTLTAKVGGNEINTGDKVAQGKTVIFTATPSSGYKVKEWKADGTVVTGNTSNTYTCTVTKAVTVKVSFLAGEASYKVKHYKEKAEGGYPIEPTETESLSGTVGTNAAYTPKTGGAYEGFTYKSELTKINGSLQTSGMIKPDGSTVVELYYERNTVNVTFNLAGGNVAGNTGPIVKTGKYGTPFTAPEPAKATGVFKGWKPALPSPLLFPASNAEHTAEWTPKAFLTLEAGKNTVKVKAKTADGSAIKVEGCSVNELANEAETTLTVTNPERKLALIGELIELDCRGSEDASNRPLVALDVSGLTALQKLDCQYNKITALNVQGLTKLEKLNCSVNELTTLDVQGLTALQQLDCSVNQIPEFNVQGCAALQKLECGGNQLTALNVQGCTVLQQLNCRSNKLTALNVQGCTALKELNCSRNQLTALDVSGLKALQELNCRSNQLATLNVQGLTALQKLDCESNQLSTLDVQGLTKLQKLDCRNNQLSALDVQGCTALKSLLCFRNKLNANAFTKLFNDLPTREASDGAKAILYTEPDVYNPQANDGNCTNFNTPESLKKAFEGAKAKHWKMQKAGVFGIPSDI